MIEMAKDETNMNNRTKQWQHIAILLAALGTGYHLHSVAWELAGLSAVTLLFFFVPIALGKQNQLRIPLFVQIILLIMIYFPIVYPPITSIPHFEYILHCGSSLTTAGIGFLLIYSQSGYDTGEPVLSPSFIAWFTLCFALTAGALWEIVEFIIDSLFKTDMQRSRSLEIIYGIKDTRLGVLDTMEDLLIDGAMSLLAFYAVKIGLGILLRMNNKKVNLKEEKGIE